MTSQMEVAAEVLELMRARAGAGSEIEVSVDRHALALTRFANSFIHQNVADQTTTLGMRLHTNGRTASATTTLASTDGLHHLADRIVDAARHAPVDPGWPGVSGPEPRHGEGGYDEATAAAAPAERAARVRAFIDATGGLTAAGFCRTMHWNGAFVNSAGQSVTGRTTEAAMDGVARRDGSDGLARLASCRLSDLDGSELGAMAAAKAHAGADPVELPPGRYEVVLEPSAVADVLHNLAMFGFNGKAYAERRSFAELGAEQFDPAVTLLDDPFAAGSPGLAYDGEGTPKRRLTLVDAGVTSAVAHDRRTAAQAGGGAASTGHAVPGSFVRGAFPVNLGLRPGPGGPTQPGVGVADPAAAGLVTGVRRGLLVTDFWYTRVLDPKSLVVTGLTRNGVWLIEDGTVTTPVRNFRFTQSYPQALGPGAVTGIGPAPTLLPNSWGIAWWSAPALHLASWNFTGGASG
jgi:predicted Zn-dependent protease